MYALRWVALFESPTWSMDAQKNVFVFLGSSDLYQLQLVNKRSHLCVYLYSIYLCKMLHNPMVLSNISISDINRMDDSSHEKFYFSSGVNHTLFSNEFGDVFTQGHNYFGQLGTGERTLTQRHVHSWTCVSIPRYCSIVRKLHADDKSSYLLTATGKLKCQI
jgi:hypothetical protein